MGGSDVRGGWMIVRNMGVLGHGTVGHSSRVGSTTGNHAHGEREGI